MKIIHSLCLVGLLAATAPAQLAPTAPFLGLREEQFDAALPAGRMLGNTATFTPSAGGQYMITYGWLVYVGYAVYPRGQSNSFLGTTVGYGIITFDQPVQRFGAWFATVGYLAGGQARVFDAANNLIGTMPLQAPRGGPWAWDGWDAGPNGPKIKRIELRANDPYNGGALLCVEDAQVDTWLGVTSIRPTGCGGLGISVSGLPVVGDTLQFALTSAGAFAGYVVGAPVAVPIGPCPGCTLGANGVTVTGSSLLLDIPNQPVFLDLQLSVQGFSSGGTACLGAWKLSDTIDVRVGE